MTSNMTLLTLEARSLIDDCTTNIILAVIGMIGLFATATIWQRANRITDRYYKANKINRDLITLNNKEFN
jgi:hypothetical protein